MAWLTACAPLSFEAALLKLVKVEATVVQQTGSEVRRAGWATAAMGLATGLAVAVPVVGRAGAS